MNFRFGKEIAKIKLNTPLNYRVALGYQKVAEFQINQKTDYNKRKLSLKKNMLIKFLSLTTCTKIP